MFAVEVGVLVADIDVIQVVAVGAARNTTKNTAARDVKAT
jgi:hypothetical protein